MARMLFALLCTIFLTLAAQLYIQLQQQPGTTFTDLIATLITKILAVWDEIPVHLKIDEIMSNMTLLPVLAVMVFTSLTLFLLRTVWTLSNNIVTLTNKMALMEKKIAQLSHNAVSFNEDLGNLSVMVHNLSSSVIGLDEKMCVTQRDCLTTSQKMVDFISNTFKTFTDKYTETTSHMNTMIAQTTADGMARMDDFGSKLTDLLRTLDSVTLNVKHLKGNTEHMTGRMNFFRDLLRHLKKYIPAPEFRMPSQRRIQEALIPHPEGGKPAHMRIQESPARHHESNCATYQKSAPVCKPSTHADGDTGLQGADAQFGAFEP